jgi:hypothetical protein
MGTTNPLKNDANENRRKHLGMCVSVLAKWFEKWVALPGSNQVSKVQLAVYAEALIDLSPEAIEFGCAEATRTAERFPWPGHIRAGAMGYRESRTEYLGPPLIEYPPITDEERAEGLKFSEALKKKLAIPPKPAAEPKKKLTVPSLRSLEEQKAELKRKGFLK